MKTHEFNDPILTTREAAQLLGVAVSTAQVWMESGDLPAWKTPGGHRRVRCRPPAFCPLAAPGFLTLTYEFI